jgi:hypothetical protein
MRKVNIIQRKTIIKKLTGLYEYGNVSIPVRIDSNKEVLEYVTKEFGWFNVINKIQNPKIKATIIQVSHIKNWQPGEGKKISKTISLNQNSVSWYSDWFKINYSFKNNALCVYIEYISFNKNVFNLLVRLLLKRKMPKEINNERLLYVLRMALHYPLFYILKKEYGIYPLHASAVCKNELAYLFLGFDGVGKSTIAIAMNKYYGYDIIADNFCLIDNEGFVYPFIEYARVSVNVSRLFANFNAEKIYGRYKYPFKKINCKNRIKLSAIFFNYFGMNDCVKESDKSIVFRMIYSMNNILPEFIDFNQFKSIINLIDNHPNNNDFDCAKLLGNVRLFGLEKFNFKKLAELTKEVHKKCISSCMIL